MERIEYTKCDYLYCLLLRQRHTSYCVVRPYHVMVFSWNCIVSCHNSCCVLLYLCLLLYIAVGSTMCSLASGITISSYWYGWKCSGSTPTVSYCSWTGVTCSGGVEVTKLDLYNKDISGTIATQIGDLTSLTYLKLYINKLTGTIPTSIGYLSSVSVLYLSYNKLTGTIPTSIGYMTLIKYLDLSINKLTGTIPTSIGYMTLITNLYLYSNKLTGTIPTSIGYLSSLSDLSVSYNSLSGQVPTSLCAATHLSYLYISNNKFNMSCYPTCLSSVTTGYSDICRCDMLESKC